MYANVDTSGKILQVSSHPVDIAGARSVHVAPGVEGSRHYIGPADEVLDIPAQPSQWHVFDWPTHQWVDSRGLGEFKDAKWEEVKAAREASINAPLATPYGSFDSGPADRANITDAVLMAQTLAALGQPVSIEFTLADNTVSTLNASQMVEVGLILGAKVQDAYATARSLREAIESAGTIAEVDAIHWP